MEEGPQCAKPGGTACSVCSYNYKCINRRHSSAVGSNIEDATDCWNDRRTNSPHATAYTTAWASTRGCTRGRHAAYKSSMGQIDSTGVKK